MTSIITNLFEESLQSVCVRDEIAISLWFYPIFWNWIRFYSNRIPSWRILPSNPTKSIWIIAQRWYRSLKIYVEKMICKIFRINIVRKCRHWFRILIYYFRMTVRERLRLGFVARIHIFQLSMKFSETWLNVRLYSLNLYLSSNRRV